MELTIKVSKLFANIYPELVSGSVSELGDNAGQVTWRNAMTLAEDFEVPEGFYEEMREHIGSYGAWDDDEINAMSELELRAFAVQEIAAEVRELTDANPYGTGRAHLDGDTLYYYIGV